MLNMKIGTRFAYITPDKLFTGETAMEVKDINNQNNLLAIFKKNSGTVSALDFSSLIAGKKQDFGSASVGLDLDRAPSVSEKSSVSKAASSVRPENSASDAVNVKPRKENKRKERTPAEEQAAPVPAENRPVPERAEAPAAPVESRSVAEGAADPASADKMSAPADASVVPTSESQPGRPSSAVPQQNASVPVMPADVESLGDIMYFDEATGSFVQTTGAELAVALKSGEITGLTMADLADVDGNPLSLQPSALPSASSEGIDISAMAPVSAEEMAEMPVMATEGAPRQAAAETTDVAKTTVVGADNENGGEIAEETTAEAEPEIIADGKKIKLDVKVNAGEEKISYRSRQEMIADTVALSEAADVAEVSNPAPEQQAPRTTTAAQANSPAAALSQGTVMPQAAVVQAFGEAAVAPAAAASASVSDAAVVSVAPAGAGTARQAQTLPGAEVKSPAEEALKGMSREVVEQVKVNITKSAVKGVDKIDVTLKPEDLGHIEIKMQISKDGKLQAHIISSRPETMEILQKDMQILQKAFADAGFQTDENSLSFSFQDNGQAWQQREEESGLRQFMGKIFENEGGNDNLPLSETAWDGKSALNIRV